MSVLSCRKLTKKYVTVEALKGIDLNLDSGKIVGLLGPNGSGKTTLIKLANGLLNPSSGTITIDGKNIGLETKGMVAYLPDKEVLPDYMTVDQLCGFYGDFYQDFSQEKADKMLKGLDLSRNMPIKKMSKGTREKVQLVLVMSRNAKVYFLDEPIAGVDPAARDYILRTIISNYSKDALVVISTHLIADIESVLDEAVFIKNGEIVLHETIDKIRENSGKSVDELFREEFKC